MPPEPTGPRARVRARNLPIDMGGLSGRVAVADVDLVPKGPDGILDLDDRHPRVVVRAARAVAPGAEIGRVARQQASGPVKDLAVRLLGQDRFEASGVADGSIPFKASGAVRALGGKLAFVPERVDLKAAGAQIHLDVPSRQARVAVPAAMLDAALRGSPDGKGQPPADWPLAEPRVTWQAADRFRLQAGLRIDRQVVPLSAQVGLGVSPDGWLRFGLSDVRLQAEGADIGVDMAARTARVNVPPDKVRRDVEAAARRELTAPRLSWRGPGAARLEGDLPLSRFLGSAAGSQKLHLVADAALGAAAGQVEARLQRLSVAGPELTIDAQPAARTARARVATDLLARILKEARMDGFRVTSLDWPAPDTWRLAADLGGTPLEAGGTLAAHAGGLRLRVDRLSTESGPDRIALDLDPAANLIRATVPTPALTRMMGGAAPLDGMTIDVAPGGKLRTSGTFKLWLIPVPVRLDGHLALGADGKPRFAVARTRMAGLDVTGAMAFFGLTLQKLDSKGDWRGNTLTIEPGGLPKGTRLAGLETTDGAVVASIRPDQALPAGAKGVRFDGETLDVDPAAALGIPGRVAAATVAGGALTVDFALDPARVKDFVQVPPGVSFDGETFRAAPAAIAHRPVPGRLTGLAAGPGGATATFALDPEVFAPLSKLPPGVRFDGSGFRVDPKQGKALPGRLTAAAGGPDGLTLRMALTEQELKGNFDLGKTGVAWDGHALLVDPGANLGGARATGAAVAGGDLVVEVGDGQTPMPDTSAERVLTLTHPGRARIQGILIDRPVVEIRPKTADGPWTTADLDKGAIKVLGGTITVPPAKLDELIRAKLGPEDYKKLRPTYDGRRLTVHVPALLARIPLALRFERASDGRLQLAPSGFFGNIPLLEWPQRLIGLLLTPFSWLIPGSDGVKIDLAEASGVGLPPLKRVEATPEGLVLDFGAPVQESR